MFIETTDKETGERMMINMDHIESVVEVGTEKDFWTELRIHEQNENCYRVRESIETIKRIMRRTARISYEHPFK